MLTGQLRGVLKGLKVNKVAALAIHLDGIDTGEFYTRRDGGRGEESWCGRRGRSCGASRYIQSGEAVAASNPGALSVLDDVTVEVTVGYHLHWQRTLSGLADIHRPPAQYQANHDYSQHSAAAS